MKFFISQLLYVVIRYFVGFLLLFLLVAKFKSYCSFFYFGCRFQCGLLNAYDAHFFPCRFSPPLSLFCCRFIVYLSFTIFIVSFSFLSFLICLSFAFFLSLASHTVLFLLILFSVPKNNINLILIPKFKNVPLTLFCINFCCFLVLVSFSCMVVDCLYYCCFIFSLWVIS